MYTFYFILFHQRIYIYFIQSWSKIIYIYIIKLQTFVSFSTRSTSNKTKIKRWTIIESYRKNAIGECYIVENLRARMWVCYWLQLSLTLFSTYLRDCVYEYFKILGFWEKNEVSDFLLNLFCIVKKKLIKQYIYFFLQEHDEYFFQLLNVFIGKYNEWRKIPYISLNWSIILPLCIFIYFPFYTYLKLFR